MASPGLVGALSLTDVLELSADELRDEVLGRYIDPKSMSKAQMQKALIKALSPVQPVARVVTQPLSPRTALSPEQQMVLEVMKLKMEPEEKSKGLNIKSEEKEKRLRMEAEASQRKEKIEAEERKELRELDREALARKEKEEAEALEKKERQEAEALEKRKRREDQDRQALQKKEAIQRQERADAL